MTTTPLAQFDQFFAEVHPGRTPFPWQRRLLAEVLQNGWPEHLNAPTGAGKTAVIDIHVFARAFDSRVPRRMLLAVNRRALVDSQLHYAQAVATALESAPAGSVAAEVRERLCELRSQADRNGSPAVLVTSWRGDQADRRDRRGWRNDPLGCQIICATPDMFGSRLLFRGYGTSRLARPLEAGLLAYDTVAVLDEAHLNRQLLATARRCSGLAGGAIGVPPLNVVASTATPSHDAPPTLTEEDFGHAVLGPRLIRPKPVALVQSADSASTLASETRRLVTESDGTVGCFVNTIDRALAVAKELSKELTVVTLVGPMRPHDRDRLSREFPGVLSTEGCPSVEVIVATQTIEVGVDLDLSAMVTELAPASSIIQRAGRVNRLGLRPSAPIVVVHVKTSRHPGPYESADLDKCQSWLSALPPETGLTASEIATSEVPVATLSRALLQRLEQWDVSYLATTSSSTSAEDADLGNDVAGLELWLRDDFASPAECGFVARAPLPEDDSSAIRMVALMPPLPHEVFSSSLKRAREALEKLHSAERRVLRLRADTLPEVAHPGDRIRPGDIFVVDPSAPIFQRGVVHAAGGSLLDEDDGDVWSLADPSPGFVTVATTAAQRAAWLEVKSIVDDLGPESGATTSHLLTALATVHGIDAPIPSYGDRPLTLDVISTDNDETLVVVLASPDTSLPEDVREVRSRRAVPLTEHGEAVAGAAREIAERAGLPPELCDALFHAGRWHDSGKDHAAFQRLLRNGRPIEGLAALAKSGLRSRERERQLRASLGLVGFRHEQRSAAQFWNASRAYVHRSLVTRLVGTSHGHGRGTFDGDAGSVLTPDDSLELTKAAEDLFDQGWWEYLGEQIDEHYSPWGAAYLEALLRAADVTTSMRGN